MSDDNWTVCPRCEKKRIADLEKLRVKVDEAYGRVDKDHYLDMVSNLGLAENYEEGIEDRNLREDYDLKTLPDGGFYIDYKCYCRKCTFSFEFDHLEQLEI